jgi:predicted RNase H-like HicB family nuclease
MRTFTAIIEKCKETGLYVGFVPGFPGAHSQGESLDELNNNLKEVITTGIAGGLISPIRALLLAPLKGDCHFHMLSYRE